MSRLVNDFRIVWSDLEKEVSRAGRPRRRDEEGALEATMAVWRYGDRPPSLEQPEQAMGSSSASFYGALGLKVELDGESLAHDPVDKGSGAGRHENAACPPREALRSTLLC